MSENKKWYKFIERNKKAEEISETLQKTFGFQNFIVNFVDYLFSFILSIIITEPLIALAHFVRTFEWTYILNWLSFLILIGFVLLIILILYFISRPSRKVIKREFIEQRQSFYSKLISITFAYLIVDTVLISLIAFSNFISTGILEWDLGNIIDQLIASLLLLIIILIIYGTIKKFKE